jgi:hypothetical protein
VASSISTKENIVPLVAPTFEDTENDLVKEGPDYQLLL